MFPVTPVRPRLRPAGVAMAAVLGLVAGACSSPKTAAPPQSTVSEPQLRAGGTLVYAADSEPTTGFNYRTTKGNTASLGTLIRRVWPAAFVTTPSLDVVTDGNVVTSVQVVSTDPQTIEYRINPAATWSDGVPISADDFIFNWQVQQPGATDIDGKPYSVVAAGEDTIQSVTGSADGKTVTAVLKSRSAEWKALFSRPLTPAHVARKFGWNSGFDGFDPERVISGGPFRIQSYNPGKDLTLVRNERYWGKPATLDSVVIRFIADSNATVTALRNREVDVIAPRVQTDLLDQLKGIPGVASRMAAGLQAEFLDFNQKSELLAIPGVRQAFALALDRQSIVARTVGQLDEKAQVMNNRLFGTTQVGYADTSDHRYDRPDIPGAKRLLEGAGFKLGGDGIYVKDDKRLSLRLRTTSGDALRESQAELIQAQVRAAGFEVRIDNAPTSALVAQLQQGDFDISSLAQGLAVFPTTTNGTFGTGGGANLSKYSNSRIDALYLQAKGELDDTKRLGLLRDIDRQLWEDMPRLPLYQRPIVVAYRDNAVNVVINASAGVLWNVETWGMKAR